MIKINNTATETAKRAIKHPLQNPLEENISR
jgi:hypothetical protein